MIYWQGVSDTGSAIGSRGRCALECQTLGFPVSMSKKGSHCYCASLQIYLPLRAASTVPAANCDTPCNALPEETCGSTDYADVRMQIIPQFAPDGLTPAYPHPPGPLHVKHLVPPRHHCQYCFGPLAPSYRDQG